MLKIISNHNKQNIIYSFTIGQSFPDVQGKLLRVELNGNELNRLVLEKEIPIHAIDNSYLVWHDKHAGRILKLLREIYD